MAGDIVLIIILAATLTTLVGTVVFKKKSTKAFKAVAKRFGLKQLEPYKLTGRVDGLEVRVEMGADGLEVRVELGSVASGESHFTSFHVSAELPSRLSIRKRAANPGVGARVLTDDPEFDRDVWVTGNQGLALTLLDAPTRRVIRDLVRRGATYVDGTWNLSLQAPFASPGELEKYLRWFCDTSAVIRTATTGSIRRRLLEQLSSEPDAGVRRRQLLHLLKTAPKPIRRRALAIAKRDVDPAIRLIVAGKLNEPPPQELIEDSAIAPELRAQALMMVCKRAPPHELEPLLDALISDDPARALPGELSDALEVGLRRLQYRRAQELSIKLIASHGVDVRLTAIELLGAIGDIDAVRALVPFRDGRFASKLKAKAEQAIREIQNRTGGDEPGALALADVEGGLALAEPDEGP